MHNFYEFFAGGGMARAGLYKSGKWNCLFANDIDEKKAASYRANWSRVPWRDHMVVDDVAMLKPEQLIERGHADLAWASFPCQDLSLAGAGAGLSGERSGAFLPFWDLISALHDQSYAPKLVVLENVVGALTAGKGEDFVTLGTMLATGGYRFGAVVINAEHWVPQSRPRLFIIAVHKSMRINEELVSDGSPSPWHTSALVAAHGRLLKRLETTGDQDSWIWWNLSEPPATRLTYQSLADVIEPGDPTGVTWHTKAETERLTKELMNEHNKKKVKTHQEKADETGKRVVGTVYKRMRPEGPVIGIDENGKDIHQKVQRAEVRFDNVAGCLRTPSGGSSRQTILILEPNVPPRSRLLSTREAARLMGLDDRYELPEKYNDAYHLAGDGVAVDVVHFLSEHILEPLLEI
ncbi:DNA cytosine methyltransferase [Nocardia sp. NBC_01327]|uniref:DNA cytosine methyltransferase n=1 Tax=Nocardia sp. NBC_01327 TaxID=2903593 RepID=UPI002E0D4E50|nr:DNA cytosine methyltransferase [Nocardia sp. NBC_01327]